MTDKFQQRGDVINRTLTAIVASGGVVVMRGTIGIALKAGAIGDLVACAVEGVYEVPKVPGAVFAQGEKLLWDASAGQFDDDAAVAAAGDIMGAVVAWVPGLNGETTALVKLTPGNTTLT